jgi:agmatine/peptidylarginine deiminase
MKKSLLLVTSFLLCSQVFSQDEILPRYLTDNERSQLPFYTHPTSRGIEEPPPFENLRNMAEWEEIQALTITWRSYPGILKQITRAAKDETKVIIFSENPSATSSYLLGNEAGGPLEDLDNIDIIDAESNSIWIRDYGANTVYGNRVDTLILVDWIYNRPRPDDDVIPEVLAENLGLNLYTTTQAPDDLVNTGGNFMSDGQGTGFASELILEENEAGNPYNVSVKTEEEIDDIMLSYQGISRFVKMTALPYDIINHIDMHMKILDEETLLVGEYPEGIADGPQINANIDYVVNTFLSTFGEEYKVVRIPMPDSPSGLWPDDNPAGYYRTYTNGVFVNNSFIYPSYRTEYDTVAARIYSELLPGYNLVPIDCDDSPEQIIAAAGAIHCITHSVGVNDPLLIVHQPLKDTEDTNNDYEVSASIEHRSGIAGANLYWRYSGNEEFNLLSMNSEGAENWSANIPASPVGSIIEYYVEGIAENGKTQRRPIVAPDGFWSFEVLGEPVGTDQIEAFKMNPVYPNPANNLVSIPIQSSFPQQVEVYITDITGRLIEVVYSGVAYGDRRISHFVDRYPNGSYLVVAQGEFGRTTTILNVTR